MHVPRYLAPIAASLAAMALLVSSACGIITAPFTVPAAIDSNAFFNFNANITDPGGMPLDNVTLHQTLNHTFWDPTKVQTTTNEPKTRQFNRAVSVNERGAHLSLLFSKEGYYDVQLDLFARALPPGSVQTIAGSVPDKSNFPVVLYPLIPADTDLRNWRGSLHYGNNPKVAAVDLTQLAGASAGATAFPLRYLDDISAAPPGTFYLNLIPAPPAATSGSQSVTLNITGGELQAMTPKPYEDALQSSDTAPDAGYQSQITLDQSRLKEMRTNTTTSHEYFFFRTQNHYGKGFIVTFGNTFNVGIWINPVANDHNLITHKPVRR